MHNVHGRHAFRETTKSRLEASDSICRHGGGEERDGSSIPAAAEPACGEPRVAARPGHVSRGPPHGFELTLRGRKSLQELPGLLPQMENLFAPKPVRFNAGEEPLSHFRP